MIDICIQSLKKIFCIMGAMNYYVYCEVKIFLAQWYWATFAIHV